MPRKYTEQQLFCAINECNTVLVQEILSDKNEEGPPYININARDSDGLTPLERGIFNPNKTMPNFGNYSCAKQSLAYLAGESPVVEGEPIPLRSESCVIGGNEDDEA